MLSYEKFEEAWNDLERKDKIALFNDYACEHCPDDQIYNFDEDFFETFFSGNPTEAVRAAYFGEITCWNDEYIRFNGYGNLVSMSDYQAAEYADEYTKEIYEHDELWSSYIDEDDYKEDEWKEDVADVLTEVFECDINQGAIEQFIDDEWDGSLSDDDNIKAFRSWYNKNFKDDKCKLGLDENACDILKDSIEEEIDDDIAARFVNEQWNYDLDDDENVHLFAEWYFNMNNEELTVL